MGHDHHAHAVSGHAVSGHAASARAAWTPPSKAQRAFAMLSLRPLARMMRSRDGVAVSVVVATRNRATYLELALASLERQVFPRAFWEVVVADDASDDDTGAVLDGCETRGVLQLQRWKTKDHVGVAAARNAALELARGKVVVFLRDDELAAPDLLVQHLRHHVGNAVFVLGEAAGSVHTHVALPHEVALQGVAPQPFLTPADLDAPEKWGAFVDENSSPSPVPTETTASGQSEAHLWADFKGGNASALRETLLALGGFDAGRKAWNLGDWGLECGDLALRLQASGTLLHREPRARVWGQMQPVTAWNARERLGELGYFFCKHAELDRAHAEPLLWR